MIKKSFLCNKKIKYQLGIVTEHSLFGDFMSFLCWYSFATYYDFLNTVVFVIGSPTKEIKLWPYKKEKCSIKYIKNFENLSQIQQKYHYLFDEKHIICHSNILMVQEHEMLPSKKDDSIIIENNTKCNENSLKIVNSKDFSLGNFTRFNCGDSDLFKDVMINNKAINPFIVEKNDNYETINEIRLHELYRKAERIYNNIIGGHDGK